MNDRACLEPAIKHTYAFNLCPKNATQNTINFFTFYAEWRTIGDFNESLLNWKEIENRNVLSLNDQNS